MITDRFFGTTCDGLQVHEYTLTNASGAAVSILDYGCTVRQILMPDKAGALTDVALGYDTVAEYETGTGYLGAAIGRYANRIGGGKFSINGAEYSVPLSDGPNALHGGLKGFDKFVWEVRERISDSTVSAAFPESTMAAGQAGGGDGTGSEFTEAANVSVGGGDGADSEFAKAVNASTGGGDRSCSESVPASNMQVCDSSNKITFHRLSPDGEEGFPGNLDVYCTFTLTDDNQITIEFRAVSDADTIINLTNHTYFNLNGQGCGDILAHQLMINSDCTTPNDSHCLPTGEIAASIGTPFDFRVAKAIGRDIASDHPQIQAFNGYDHNFVLQGACGGSNAADAGDCAAGMVADDCLSLNTAGGSNASDAGDCGAGMVAGDCLSSNAAGGSNAADTGDCGACSEKTFAKVGCGDIPFALAASLTGDISGITLNIYTDMPGIQLYTGNALTARSGKGGTSYGQYSGLALETQNFPDAPNKPHFPSALLKAGESYYTKTVWEFR